MPKITRHGGPSFAGEQSLGPVPEDAVLDQRHLPEGVRHPHDGSTKTEADSVDATPAGEQGAAVESADPDAPDSGQAAETVQGEQGEVPPADSQPPPTAPAPQPSDPAERPAVRDPKDVWVDYAVSLGLVRQAAEERSKTDLIEVVKAIEDGTHTVAEDGQLVEVPALGGESGEPAEG